ncbi:MAG TPA: DUF4133 domain-containing protein [Puia sp.]
MTPIIYSINRGINQPLEFRGLKAQYILYAGGIVLSDLLLYAILYISGLSSWICLPICGGLGMAGIGWCYKCSRLYGGFGWMKKRAAKGTAMTLKCSSRRLFTQL